MLSQGGFAVLNTTKDFIDLVSRYEAVALMANSEDVDVDAIVASLPANTLFVFFTGCAKILKHPFPGDAILCHRVVGDGSAFLKSDRTFAKAHSLFRGTLKGEVAVLADYGQPDDVAPPAQPRKSPLLPVTLDFDHALGRFYSAGSTPTTGFAVAMWLMKSVPAARIVLCGFTGVAGSQFKLFGGHDWTFEQTALQLFGRSGQIRRLGEQTPGLERLARNFPQFDRGEVALVATEVLTRQLGGLDRRVTLLWTLTRIPRAIQNTYARFRRRVLQR